MQTILATPAVIAANIADNANIFTNFAQFQTVFTGPAVITAGIANHAFFTAVFTEHGHIATFVALSFLCVNLSWGCQYH